MELNLDNKCRACLAENDEMISLFDVYEHDLTLAMILQSCMSLEINENDGLPSHLCDNCILVLTQFYNFTVVYEESDKQIKSLLRKHKRNLEATTVTQIETEVGSNDFPESELILTNSNEQLNNITTIVNLEDPSEQDVPTDYQESVEYYEVKNGNYYVEEGQEINNIDYVKDNVEILKEFKKEIVLDDEVDNSETNEYIEVRVADVENVKIKEEKVLPHQESESLEYETIIKYECSICSEAHLYAASFQQHMYVKHHMSDVDSKDYAKKVRIKANNRKLEPIYDPDPSEQNDDKNDIKHNCKLCDKIFFNRAQLQQHLKMHEMHKKYVCEICGSRFIRKNYLVDHMEGHSSEKKHICKYCGKAYRRRTVLRAHKRVHTHPNYYICELCGRAFTNSSTLKTHRLLIHIKERNFQCVICNLTFPLKSTLNKHVLRHQKRENGEKGFDCHYCDMQYRDKSSLKRHVETKHQGKSQLVSCPDCPKKYTSKANLMKHRRKQHSLEILK